MIIKKLTLLGKIKRNLISNLAGEIILTLSCINISENLDSTNQVMDQN